MSNEEIKALLGVIFFILCLLWLAFGLEKKQ